MRSTGFEESFTTAYAAVAEATEALAMSGIDVSLPPSGAEVFRQQMGAGAEAFDRLNSMYPAPARALLLPPGADLAEGSETKLWETIGGVDVHVDEGLRVPEGETWRVGVTVGGSGRYLVGRSVEIPEGFQKPTIAGYLALQSLWGKADEVDRSRILFTRLQWPEDAPPVPQWHGLKHSTEARGTYRKAAVLTDYSAPPESFAGDATRRVPPAVHVTARKDMFGFAINRPTWIAE
ncbi:MAG TPA: hypothetical protein VK674_00895 [Candidatus Limnocylindria bacterium]|nr:hypothetical protein [Candidatus Limnocylindria bacterium]